MLKACSTTINNRRRPPLALKDVVKNPMDFKIIGKIRDIESIAAGRGINDLARLQKKYGKGRWRKIKGFAKVKLRDNSTHTAEIHWYEAHGIGKKEFKLKFPLID